ncbi:heparan sulfate 2-O-sulfotransferase 1 isoform X2 [Nothobranchius furzeri]
MGILRTMMPPKIQLLAVLAFGVAMLLIENQIQRLDESRAKLEHTIARHEVAEVELRHSEDVFGQELTPLSETDDTVIIYNRVPKTASTSFTNIAYDLCSKNHYHVLHINTTKNNPVLSLQDQVRFVQNVSTWREMKPGFYHGHVAYLDFSKYGVKGKPMYINVVRDPIERLVSYYYFLRFGDDYRPGLRRRKQGDKKCSEECPDLYIGETKQPLHKRMAQHRRATSTGQDSAVHLHLKDKGHSFEDANVHILDGEDRWFERGVKEAIYVHCEQPSLNRGGGLRHQLSAIYNPVLRSLPRCLNAHAYPGPSELRNSHDRVGPGFTMSSPQTLAE